MGSPQPIETMEIVASENAESVEQQTTATENNVVDGDVQTKQNEMKAAGKSSWAKHTPALLRSNIGVEASSN